MLRASQPTVYVHVFVRQEDTTRRPPGVSRCLFGKPNPQEVRRQLDEEQASSYKRFSNRYEVCSNESRSPNKSSSLVSSRDDSSRKRVDSVPAARSPSNSSPKQEPKRQKLLTEYWSKSRDSRNTSRPKSS